jgi:hypothetical protein
MAVQTIQMPSIEAQRANVATWSSAPDPLRKRGTDPKQIEYLNRLVLSEQRIAAVGEQPVTVVNLNPYFLMVNHPMFDGIKVAPCQDGKLYSALVIRSVLHVVDTGLDHNHKPEEFWPIQLGNEFVFQYREKGGVFLIKGNIEKHPELEQTEEFKTKYHEAREALFEYCFTLKRAADNEWNTPQRSGARNIHESHRQAARILVAQKKIVKLPEWVDVLVATEDVQPECPRCQADTKKSQPLCVACGFVLDPAIAFERGLIDEFNSALERLTREQVAALSISAYVAETVDERPVRLKAGKPKPLSHYERQMQTQAEAEQALAHKAAEKLAKDAVKAEGTGK